MLVYVFKLKFHSQLDNQSIHHHFCSTVLKLPCLFLIATCLVGNDPGIQRESLSRFVQIFRIKFSISKPLGLNVGCQDN